TWAVDNGTGGNVLTGAGASSLIKLAVHNNAGAGTNAVYVALDSGSALANVFRSADRGTNRAVVGTVPHTHPGGQAFPNTSIVADPVDANVVFVSGDRGTANNAGNVFRFNPGTNTWDSVANAGASNTAPHPDSRAMVFDSTGANRALLFACDGGLYR